MRHRHIPYHTYTYIIPVLRRILFRILVPDFDLIYKQSVILPQTSKVSLLYCTTQINTKWLLLGGYGGQSSTTLDFKDIKINIMVRYIIYKKCLLIYGFNRILGMCVRPTHIRSTRVPRVRLVGELIYIYLQGSIKLCGGLQTQLYSPMTAHFYFVLI